jgi:pimeloyl-ACP methyl ester carboxylesterase
MRSQLRGDGRRYAAALDRRLTIPVMQIQGAVDPYVVEATVHASRQWLPARTRYQCLPGVGHFPHHEAPAVVNQLLRKHFDSVHAAH